MKTDQAAGVVGLQVMSTHDVHTDSALLRGAGGQVLQEQWGRGAVGVRGQWVDAECALQRSKSHWIGLMKKLSSVSM